MCNSRSRVQLSGTDAQDRARRARFESEEVTASARELCWLPTAVGGSRLAVWRDTGAHVSQFRTDDGALRALDGLPT